MRQVRWGLAIAMVVAGCGSKDQVSTLSSEGTFETPFATWCADWGLRCDASDQSVTQEKMQATLALGEAVVAGPTELVLTREAWLHPDLKQVMAAWKIEDALAPFVHNVEVSQLQSFEVRGGSGHALLRFESPQSFGTPSGLSVVPEVEATVAPHADGSINFTGLSVASPDKSRQDELATLMSAKDGTMTWQGTHNIVTQIPVGFFPTQLGIEMAKFPSEIEQNAVLGSLPALMNVLVVHDQHIALDRSFWDVVLSHLDILVEDPAGRENARLFSEVLDRMDAVVHHQSHGEMRGVFQNGQTVACESQGGKPVQMNINSSFGLERMERLAADSIRLTFYGIKVKSRIFGPVTPSFNLKRVDVFADKLVVRDIPIIGSYTIRLDGSVWKRDVGDFHCRRG